MRGEEGLCGVCGCESTGVRPRHAQGAYVCGLCDDGRRDRRDYHSQAAYELHRDAALSQDRAIYGTSLQDADGRRIPPAFWPGWPGLDQGGVVDGVGG